MVKKTKKVLSTIFIVLIAAFLFSTSVYVAQATLPLFVEGQIIVQGYKSIVAIPAGGSDNSIITSSLYGLFMGDISGSYNSESHWIRHNVGAPDVWTNIHAIDIISPATVMDKTGTLVFMLDGSAAEGGNWVIIGGTGELASLNGQGTYSPGANPAIINYEGQVHFDP